MNRLVFTYRRLGAAAALTVTSAAFLGAGWMPAGAQSLPGTTTCPAGPPVLSIGNPNPGDLLSQGGYIISGAAYDPNATDGTSGIARVDVFLGSRESGGQFLGSVVPGQNAPSPRMFQLDTTIPSNILGGRDFVAYAYSAVDSQETTVSVPVFVGSAPTPTPTTSNLAPVALSETMTSTCEAATSGATGAIGTAATTGANGTTGTTGSAATTGTTGATGATGTTASATPLPMLPQPAATSATATPAQISPALALSSVPVLSLANPSPNDLLPIGNMFVSGVAYDPTAAQGTSGVDSVEFFLDSRDSGGLNLGSGTPDSDHNFSVKIAIPSNVNGGHTFYAYAHSSVTGRETVVSVPVFVGISPTPTPRPTS